MAYIEHRWNAQRIRTLRQRLQLSQSALGERIGVTFVTISRWENGHAWPSPLAERALDDVRASVGANVWKEAA